MAPTVNGEVESKHPSLEAKLRYPSSHNHGSMGNGPIVKERMVLETSHSPLP